jgi:nifR3 family TIM-barrel protein
MADFWTKNSGPVFSLAPMEDVTDTVFREVVMSMASPGNLHLMMTEFASVEGLNHPVGRKRVAERLVINESERQLRKEMGIKLVAQIWGLNPEIYHNVAKWITDEYDFDGIDINMGCPVKKVIKMGACSALIKDPAKAGEIIQAVKSATHLPVSVKTRTGISRHETERWIPFLLEQKPAAITLHGRTQKMQSEGLADWEQIALAVRLRDEAGLDIPIHGNGDVMSVEDGLSKVMETGADGIMVGRGIFHNPWFFHPDRVAVHARERIDQLLFHTRLFEQTWQGRKNFNILKRFYKIYLNGFPGAAHIRADVMETKSYDEVYRYFEQLAID